MDHSLDCMKRLFKKKTNRQERKKIEAGLVLQRGKEETTNLGRGNSGD